ncbi:hypothetical protein E4T56_gene2380, partial [Termitomyces sp. T112]
PCTALHFTQTTTQSAYNTPQSPPSNDDSVLTLQSPPSSHPQHPCLHDNDDGSHAYVLTQFDAFDTRRLSACALAFVLFISDLYDPSRDLGHYASRPGSPQRSSISMDRQTSLMPKVLLSRQSPLMVFTSSKALLLPEFSTSVLDFYHVRRIYFLHLESLARKKRTAHLPIKITLSTASAASWTVMDRWTALLTKTQSIPY